MVWIAVSSFAGLCIGLFALPMKFTKNWKWEHSWSLYAFWTLFVAPWVLAYFTIPNLFEVYSQQSIGVILRCASFGTLWGVASITFGLGLAYMGMAIGYSLMVGLIIVSGSVLPLAFDPPESGFTKQIAVLLAGVLVMMVSLVINVIAAHKREKLYSDNIVEDSRPIKSFLAGIVACIITGILGAGLSYAYKYGGSIAATAKELGASDVLAPNAILPVALTGAALINLLYCFMKVNKGKSWQLYTEGGNWRYFLYTIPMAVWTVGMALFGISAAKMGELGNSVGWAVTNASAIIFANLVGIISGEWKGVDRKTIAILSMALVIMILGIVIVGYSNSL